MKYMGVAEAKAKFSECIEQAQAEPVVILSHGKPAALVVGVGGIMLEQIAGDERQLAALLEERSKSKKRPWKDARERLLAGQRRRQGPAQRQR